MKKRQILKILIIATILFTLPATTFAHSGRTDSSGGHRDNQNKSGLGYYHYHCGGYPAHLHPNGVCPYASGYSDSSRSSSSSSKVKRPAKVRKVKSVNKGYTSITLRWKKVKKANGYQIYRATKKHGRYRLVKTIKKRSKTTFKDRKLKANKTYYYKVRAYKAANHKKYKGKFSAKVKAKTKPALYVSQNAITIQNSGKIKVTFKVNDTIYYEVDNEDIVSCQWDRKWNRDSIYLNLTGKKEGITYITITNRHNSEKKRIKVTVKDLSALTAAAE